VKTAVAHRAFIFITAMLEIRNASSPDDIKEARQLFEEYASSVGISLCFQNFDQEIATLPGKYAPPQGRLLLVSEHNRLAGCVALRPLANGACEMKRLYVRPEFRGLGLGRRVVDDLVNAAKEIGYHSMKLDTLPDRMGQALRMYEAMGFKEIPPYYANPVAGARFMELDLREF